MRLAVLIAFLVAIFGCTYAQNYDHLLAGFGQIYRPRYISALRDPRSNRGPVLFPQNPPTNSETSGVIPGASGFGFVPPNQAFWAYFY